MVVIHHNGRPRINNARAAVAAVIDRYQWSILNAKYAIQMAL